MLAALMNLGFAGGDGEVDVVVAVSVIHPFWMWDLYKVGVYVCLSMSLLFPT